MSRSLDRSRPILCFVHDARSSRPPRELLGIGDDTWARVDLLQVRGKDLPAGDLEDLTRDWIARLAGRSTRIVVNDRLDVALASGAHGVHLGREDLPLDQARTLAPTGFLVGGSTHDRDELLAAQTAGADYAGLGAFFPTGTKQGAPRLDRSRAAVAAPIPELEIPVLAIGGVTSAGIPGALRVPVVTGVAVSAAIQAAPDPGQAIRDLHRALQRAWEEIRETVAS